MLRVVRRDSPVRGAVTTLAAMMPKMFCVLEKDGKYSIRKGSTIVSEGKGHETGLKDFDIMRRKVRRVTTQYYSSAAGGDGKVIKIRATKPIEAVLGPVRLSSSDTLITNFN